MRRMWLTVTFIALVTTLVAGCGNGAATTTGSDTLAGTFSVTGSNTVTPITSIWAEDFMADNPDVNISVSGPGSGAGIAALINGTTDVCQASRAIKQQEIEQARANDVEPYEIQVASDALSVIVNPGNPIDQLTIAQLSAIYTNKITNWNELGGNDAPIVVISRDTNSGTHVFFKEHVVQMEGLPAADKSLEYGQNVQFLPSTEEGVNQVASNAGAIFFAGLGYLNDKVKAVAIKQTDEAAGVLPSVETALDGTYPIARPLLYYTNGEPAGVIKAFIDFCLSDKGQQDVTEAGFVPVR